MISRNAIRTTPKYAFVDSTARIVVEHIGEAKPFVTAWPS